MKYQAMISKEKGKFILVNTTGERVYESENPEEYKKLLKKARANLARAQRDEAMRSCGLTKVRGAVSGKIYWE